MAAPCLDAGLDCDDGDDERDETNPNPARLRFLAGEQPVERLDDDVGREQEEADGDDLLGAGFCVVGVDALAGEAPMMTMLAIPSIVLSRP